MTDITEAFMAFEEFPKIPRLKREVVVTEKIDGTNAQIGMFELGSELALSLAQKDPFVLRIYPGDAVSAPIALKAGSRSRWLDTTSKGDNFGFAKWVLERSDELRSLGVGRHFGEWYGQGIQRNYSLAEKRFALFNVARWTADHPQPACCHVVPILARGEDVNTSTVMERLFTLGSVAVPGFQNPEGIVVWHSAARQLYKMTFEQDGGKWRGE